MEPCLKYVIQSFISLEVNLTKEKRSMIIAKKETPMLTSRTLFSVILSLSITPSAFAKENCNEKIRQQIVKAGMDKCGGKIKDGTWSEGVFNLPADQSKMDLVFGFKCADGKLKDKSYLGLVNFSINNKCSVGKPELSHVNVLNEDPISE